GLGSRLACSEYHQLHHNYMAVAAITRELKQVPCKWDLVTQKRFEPSEVESAILHMLSPKWWSGRLRHIAESWQEHLQIALGTVSKKHNAYASSMAVSDWYEKK
ncbi:replication endonuclease, partial [Pantoea ananatis]